MAPKKASGSSKAGEEKRKVVRKTIEFKKELIAKYESGVRVSVLAKEFGMAKSTISTILNNKDQLKASDVAKGSSVLSKQRPQVLEEVEKLLLIFVNEKQLSGNTLSEDAICAKAKLLYKDLIKKFLPLFLKGLILKPAEGGLKSLRKEVVYTPLFVMGRQQVRTRQLLISLKLNSNNVSMQSNMFPNKCSIWTKQDFSGRKCQEERISLARRSRCPVTNQ